MQTTILVLSGVVVFLGLVILIVEILIPRGIVLLGNVDSWWSPFRTLPPPGEIYILVSGDPDGPFDSILESVIGWRYEENGDLFREDPADIGERSGYLPKLGVAWVGFNKYFLWREVRYDKWEKMPDPSTEWKLISKTRGVKSRPNQSPSIFFRYNMATSIEGAETIGNFPVDGVVVFTVQIERPRQAFFFAGGWEAQTNAAVQSVFREYVGTKTIDDLRQEQAAGADALVRRVKDLTTGNGALPGSGLRDLFGISIVDARFVKFDLIAGDQAMTNAVRAVEIAKQKAAARREEAEGNRDGDIAEAAGTREKVAAWGSNPVGAAVAMAEAIKIAKPAAIGGDILASINAERKQNP
ncbi:MAG: hypothetical protein A2758_01930 [Candidatus Zambryskibacteria bacterium RIFCSPHIGHO2_01_FULL_49_18]|uniref:Band 7 domain-containing protein n=2 Tax=Candidatus Zambryskiibacteriota TaxID=1817925 RepID=A0A1G2T257_9BACT|nr:MAG: hypothetical protein A2758_01930 [Candidatus Zambryskibacteria bacterium RIFCSPHIGHO2_01_FULL_49_18]OHB05109.1 MAG: hypothetical protein A3A26_00695 [Candidatus Zambryskibacteria bacterium RIFCSPLOWO2_01_FULL_47_14]